MKDCKCKLSQHLQQQKEKLFLSPFSFACNSIVVGHRTMFFGPRYSEKVEFFAIFNTKCLNLASKWTKIEQTLGQKWRFLLSKQEGKTEFCVRGFVFVWNSSKMGSIEIY